MEASPVPAAALALLLVASGLGLAADPGLESHPPPCERLEETASHGDYHGARLRSTGYIEGNLDVLAVDEAAAVPGPFFGDHAPFLGDESWKPWIARDVHVVGEPLNLVYPGVVNNLLGGDLEGGTPTTEVEAHAHATGSGTDGETFTGATRISMVFTGRIVVHEPEEVECGSFDGGTKTLTGRLVELEGFATEESTDDDVQDPWGTGLDVEIRPGPDERR